jgi:hypothetical protein
MKINIIVFLFFFCFALFAQEEYNFSQKGGMIPKGAFQIYIRTNDEYTGFTTLIVGFRYGLFDKFQFAVEAGVGIKVYLIGLLTYTEFVETDSKRFFFGLRTRTGFKFQNTYIKLGKAVLDEDRLGFYIATDFTTAFRLGEDKRRVFYYTLYPFFDIDIRGKPVEIYFSPIHVGFEFAFKRNPKWSFAYETGYFFPLNKVPKTSWFNFPNLANVGFYYTFKKD